MNLNKIENALVTGTRVLVEVEKIKEKSSGGIYLGSENAQKEQDRMSEGVLIDFGHYAFQDMMHPEELPQPGQYVFFVKYAGKAITIEDKEYRVINDEDVYLFKKED